MKVWADFVWLTSADSVALRAPRFEERSTLSSVTYTNESSFYPFSIRECIPGVKGIFHYENKEKRGEIIQDGVMVGEVCHRSQNLSALPGHMIDPILSDIQSSLVHSESP